MLQTMLRSVFVTLAVSCQSHWASSDKCTTAEMHALSLVQIEARHVGKNVSIAKDMKVNRGHKKQKNRRAAAAANMRQTPTAATLPPALVTGAPRNAAEATGVVGNAAADGAAFISALIVNTVIILVCFCLFMNLRRRFPLTYSNNVIIGIAPTAALGNNPTEVDEHLNETWGWWRASMKTTTEQVADSIGLDMAMLLEFTNLGRSMLMRIGLPMMLIIGPMNCAFGGQPAWKEGDYLSSLSFGNIENGSWLYWVHAFVVWYVVFVVQSSLYNAQKEFLTLRHKWLHEMSSKRANTLMVTNIPEDYRSDAKLQSFFGDIFGSRNVMSAYVVKDASVLTGLLEAQENAATQLEEARLKWEKNGSKPEERPTSYRHGDTMEYLNSLVADLQPKIAEERKRIKNERDTIGGINCAGGFVTFTERKYAEMAWGQLYSSDADEWQVESAPQPMDVIWSDLAKTPRAAAIGDTAGSACVVGLYFAYMPCVIGISTFCTSVDLGPLWAALAPTIGLQIMVGFLPTFLLLIYRTFCTLKSNTYAQKRLQLAYFAFQIVFVVLVTSISGSVLDFTLAIFTDPLSIPGLLGETMPPATHFFMNFLALQWVTHSQQLVRYVMLTKFHAFRYLHEEEQARKLSEPEDQDYYGIGSRSARFSINMVIAIVFGTLCPPMNVLCWINFYICRLVYGYLIPFAETKKPDLGGAFWVDKLKSLFVGNIIYCIVMIGVLNGRAEVEGMVQPAGIAAPSLLYVVWSMRRFDTAFTWLTLPITEVLGAEKSQRKLDGEYVQTELSEQPMKR
jgi:hypothetical protein